MMLNRLFNKDAPERDDGLVQVAKVTELNPYKLKRVVVKGQPILLVMLEKATQNSNLEIVAFSSICPHALGDLSQGYLTKAELDCPVHYYRFYIRTGACNYPKDGPKLRTYPIIVEGNAVLLKIEKPKWMEQADDEMS